MPTPAQPSFAALLGLAFALGLGASACVVNSEGTMLGQTCIDPTECPAGWSCIQGYCLPPSGDDESSGSESGEGDSGDGDGDGDGDAGDGDGDAGDDATGDGDAGDGDGALSHALEIQPIWDSRCTEQCHEPGGISAFLDLSDGYNSLVGVASSQAELALVEPGASFDSYVVAKLRGTHAEVGGSGAMMPVGMNASPLQEDTIVLIEAWIDAGALP